MSDDELAKIVWDYQVLNQKVEKSDCILVLGNSDLRTAEKAAELFNHGYADRMVIAGGLGRITKDIWHTTEAQVFADIAVQLGVPAEKILLEDKSQNTFDNFYLTENLLKKNKITANSFIIVTKPYAERRVHAIACKIWPTKKFFVTSPNIDFADYPNEVISKELTINLIVGDLQRLQYWGGARQAGNAGYT